MDLDGHELEILNVQELYLVTQQHISLAPSKTPPGLMNDPTAAMNNPQGFVAGSAGVATGAAGGAFANTQQGMGKSI